MGECLIKRRANKAVKYYTLTVIGGAILGYETNYATVKEGTRLVISPYLYPDKDFTGWYINNTLYSSNITDGIVVNSDITINSTYNNAKTMREATILNVIYSAENKQFTTTAIFTIPDSQTLKYASIIATINEEVGYDVDYDNCGYISGKSNPSGYSQLFPLGTENPSQLGWYEQQDSSTYVLTQDTIVDATKTYYVNSSKYFVMTWTRSRGVVPTSGDPRSWYQTTYCKIDPTVKHYGDCICAICTPTEMTVQCQ